MINVIRAYAIPAHNHWTLDFGHISALFINGIPIPSKFLDIEAYELTLTINRDPRIRQDLFF
jgi:hypothetical protein